VSGIVKLVLNDVELDPSQPRAVIDFQIDRVAVTFRRAQFLSLNGMVNYFVSYLRRELVRSLALLFSRTLTLLCFLLVPEIPTLCTPER
jgi:hypothetical protein